MLRPKMLTPSSGRFDIFFNIFFSIWYLVLKITWHHCSLSS